MEYSERSAFQKVSVTEAMHTYQSMNFYSNNNSSNNNNNNNNSCTSGNNNNNTERDCQDQAGNSVHTSNSATGMRPYVLDGMQDR